MKTLVVLAVVLLVILTVGQAHGRLGDTEQQLIARYGAPANVSTNDGLRSVTFRFKEYWVQARLREGRSVAEFAYLRSREARFTEDAALAIASQIAGATNWSEASSGLWEKTWVIKPPGLYASMNRPSGKPNSVMVTTFAELERESAKDRKARTKAADGF